MNKLKIGQSFEVVEVLKHGFTDTSLFKIGGFTIGISTYDFNCVNCVINGENYSNNRTLMWMEKGEEIKPIGKLTITKLK